MIFAELCNNDTLFLLLSLSFLLLFPASSPTPSSVIPVRVSVFLPPRQVAFEGQAFNMSCSAEGAPPPTYAWHKSGIRLQSGSTFDVGNDGGLVIHTVDGSLEGNYMCSATNTLPNSTIIATDSTSTNLRTISECIMIPKIH